MSGPKTLQIEAPAKINLGLELLGKRADGYHEIRTIMAMIGLTDRLVVRTTTEPGLWVQSDVDVGDEQNLVATALDSSMDGVESGFGVGVNLTKHIPIAAGLGGASSDASATLLAVNALLPRSNRHQSSRLAEIAASIGSDVPFFLGSPLAVSSGTGTTLTAIPSLACVWYAVLASPPISMPRKTATLYSAIRTEDFTDGGRTRDLLDRLSTGSLAEIDSENLANPFRSAWRRLGDLIAPVEVAFQRAGAPFVALSGAGPTVYTLTDDHERASSLAAQLRSLLNADVAINIAPLLSHPVRVIALNEGRP